MNEGLFKRFRINALVEGEPAKMQHIKVVCEALNLKWVLQLFLA